MHRNKSTNERQRFNNNNVQHVDPFIIPSTINRTPREYIQKSFFERKREEKLKKNALDAHQRSLRKEEQSLEKTVLDLYNETDFKESAKEDKKVLSRKVIYEKEKKNQILKKKS